jgi:hypothetical protein
MSALLGIFATACSSDDDITSAPDEQKNGNDSYICVRIHAADNASTRADATTPTYKYGTSDEQKINKITFYFFDGEDLIAKSELSENELKDAIAKASKDGVPDENVEYNAKAVFKISTSVYPTKVVAVVNAPDDFVALSPLDTGMWKQTISGIDAWRQNATATNSFVMSSSTYINNNADYLYFTDLGDNSKQYFYNTESEANAESANVVDIYVERLACKVTLNTSETLDQTSGNDATNRIYKITDEKVVGMGDTAIGIYAKLENWGLNATTTSSYILKNGTVNGFSFDANDPTNHRSYWAWSTNYGIKDINNTTSYPPYYESLKKDQYLLNYISEDDMNTKGYALGKPGYCNENTNTVALSTPSTSAVTNVLVNATLTDATGNLLNGNGNIIRYLGTYYTYNAYMDFVGSSENLKGVTVDGAALSHTTLKIADLDNDDLKKLGITTGTEGYGYTLNGRIAVQLGDNITDSNLKLNGAETTVKDVNKLLAEFNSKRKAIAYNGGNMYYTIPIRHLASSDDKEGYYGVVRNHWYDVTITNITKPGHGISDPKEPIIPNEEDKEYYIQASINVLSWRVLTQNVTL